MKEAGPEVREVVSQRVGEVVESVSDRFTAQCYGLYQSPPLGAFVRTLTPVPSPTGRGDGGEGIYAVVYSVSTQSLDPGRTVIARGENEESEQDVYQSNPQFSRLLRTSFESVIVGHKDGTGYNQYLPSMPPRIHGFVYSCTPAEVEEFTRSLNFLHLLLNSAPTGRALSDEVIAACLRLASSQRDEPRGFLVQAGKTLAVELTGDLPRLNALLRKLAP